MTFLGSRPDSFGYSSTSYDHFSGNAVTTTFNLSRSVTTESDIEVIVNNVVQDPGVAYLVSNLNTLTFTSPPSAAYPNNIVVVYRNFVNSGVSPAANTVTSAQIATGAIQYYHLATGLFNPVVTNFTGNGSNTSFTLSQTPPAANGVSVTVNGITQTSPANYSISGNNLVFTSAPANGAAIRAAQQSISVGLVPLDNSVTTSKIQAGAVTSAQIASYGITNTSIANNTITASQIANNTITGTQIANGAISNVQIDFASANGTGAILIPIGNTAQRPAASAGYIRYNTTLNTLESANGSAWANVGSGSATSSGGGGVSWQAVQNNSFIAVAGNGYAVNTAIANVTVTLPSSPTIGSLLTFVDYNQSFSSNNLILYPNGNKIQGNTSNVTISTNGQAVNLVYVDATKGWLNYSSGYSVGNYSIDYLIIAGGASGGTNNGGGGGAGGVLVGASVLVTSGTSYNFVIGGGGASIAAGANANGNAGTNTTAFNLAAIGGGYGGGNNGGVANAGAGGSGGGGGNNGGGAAGSGTSGQGNPGGLGYAPVYYGGGGGGGATSSGSNASGTNAGNGGSGYTWSNGSSYAGGGGGAISSPSSAGSGGSGGGGGGGVNGGSPAATSASVNTGSGGGGSGSGVSGAGGSGIVVVRYLSPIARGTGGTITQSGGYTYHTFNSSGTFTA